MGASRPVGHGDGAPSAWALRRVGIDEPVETLPELLAALLVEKAPATEQRRALHDLLDLPVAAAMPGELRRAVEAFLDG